MKKIIILANPEAGPQSLFRIANKKLKKQLEEKRIPYQIYRRIEDIPIKNLTKTVDRFIILGGDGTLSFAARFLYPKYLNIPIGIIPVGSGNVFAQTLGIPLLIKKAIKVALTGVPKEIYPGLINKEQIFILCVTSGIHADLMEKTPRWSKKMIGTVSYYLRLPFHLVKIKSHRYTLSFPEKNKMQIQASAIFILNGLSRIPRYPFNKMSPFKPLLYTLILEVATPLEIAQAFASIFIRGKMPKGVHYYETKSVGLETTDAPISLDSEKIADKKLSITIAPKAIRFLLPK